MKRIECLLVLVFMMGSVLGIEGVSPGSYEVDFEVGLERDFVFDFVLNGEEDLRVLGELSEYVVLNQESFFGGEVVASLKLPESLEDYGVNNIWILAGDVAAIIKVNIPYPEKYVGLNLAVPDANAGEEVSINLEVSAFGDEKMLLSPVVEVYFGEELVDVFEVEETLFEVSEVKKYDFLFDSVNYSSGEYFAIVRVDNDGGMFEVKDFFRLGEFDIEILNYTREVEGGDIERFEIEVGSLDNERMKKVYAEVRAVVGGSGFAGFDSSVVSLFGWEKKALVGYIDTRELEGDVSLVINVHYDGKVESKIVSIHVEEKSSFIFLIVIGLIFVVVGFFVWLFFGKSK